MPKLGFDSSRSSCLPTGLSIDGTEAGPLSALREGPGDGHRRLLSVSLASPAFRSVAYGLLLVFFVLSLLGSWGGPDLFGDAQPAIWGLILIVWFSAELRRESGKWIRRLLCFGIASGALLAVGTLSEILFA